MSTAEQAVAPTATKINVESAEQAVAEPQVEGEGTPEPEAEPRPVKTAEQKELEALRRSRTKAERNNARLWEENQRLHRERSAPPQAQRSEQTQQPDRIEVSRQEYEQNVERRAGEVAQKAIAQREIAARCNDVLDKGTAKYKNFTELVVAAGSELPLFDRDDAPTAALEEVLDSKAPIEILRYLGENPDVAAELSELSPRQLTRRLVALEAEIATPTRQRSAAPEPQEPEKPAAASSSPDPVRNPAAWREWRNKQEAAARKR